MGRKLEDLTGKLFNGIKVLRLHSTKTGRATKWDCICFCGKEFTTTGARLKSSKTKSCGCQRYHYSFIEDIYSYRSYNSMKQRCLNPKNSNYFKYGGAGVTVCERWSKDGEEGFLNFLEDMGSRPLNCSLNRINSSLVYSKETCEWATNSTQSFDQSLRKDTPEEISGIKFRVDRQKWVSFISVGGEVLYLYYGDSKDEAIRLRREAEIKYYGYQKGER